MPGYMCGFKFSYDIKDGTSCLAQTPYPGILGRDCDEAPLSKLLRRGSASGSTEAGRIIETIQRAVREALNRGEIQVDVQDEDLLKFVDNEIFERSLASNELFRLQVDRLNPTRLLMKDEIDAYRKDVREEFESKTMKSLQDTFENEKNKQQAHIDYYFYLRPYYYNSGYRKPVDDIFKDIVPAEAATILGHRVVGGLHRKFIEKVSDLANELEKIKPGLSGEARAELTTIGGFYPRLSKGLNQNKLSNHAFGMAIDVNSKYTPQIKDPAAIQILNQIVGQKDFDFSAFIIKKGEDLPEMDRIMETYNRYQQASETIKGWLNTYLPYYETYKAKKDKKEICAPDENLRKLETLVNKVGLGETKRWASKGIQSIPFALAIAMKNLGFAWGAQYEKTKDPMHFELLGMERAKTEQKPKATRVKDHAHRP